MTHIGGSLKLLWLFKMSEIILIAAVAKDSEGKLVIGKDGDIPWNPRQYKGDQKRFKDLTIDHSVVMGKTTYFSIPERYRPLDRRRNIILSTTEKFPNKDLENDDLYVARNMDQALRIAEGRNNDGLIFAAGGQTIYEQLIGNASRLEITEIPETIEGDTFFPRIGDEWIESFRDKRDEGHYFVTYVRK